MWKDEATGAVFKGDNFWLTAKKIWKYRKLNKRPDPHYEKSQLDLLIAKRKQLGLPMTLRGQPVGKTEDATDRQARLEAWKQRRKPKGGCRPCGRTKTKGKRGGGADRVPRR